MKDQKYNGWTNYETWNLALWMDGDFWYEQAHEAYDRAKPQYGLSKKDTAIADLSKRIEDHVDENVPLVTGFYADIINASIREVNFYEIAEKYIETFAEEAPKK